MPDLNQINIPKVVVIPRQETLTNYKSSNGFQCACNDIAVMQVYVDILHVCISYRKLVYVIGSIFRQ